MRLQIALAATLSLALAGPALAQATTQPTFATRKVDGLSLIHI